MKEIMEYNNFFNSLPKDEKDQGYVSGPMFINIAREYNENIPKYGKYIELRREKNQSTSRKDFFKDILNLFSSDVQEKIKNKCKEISDLEG